MADTKLQMLVAALKNLGSTNSTVGKSGDMSAYQEHVFQAQQNGQQPMTLPQFQQAQLQNQQGAR